MTTSAAQIRAWTGPAVFGYGYRPFFLLAGIWAALAMLIWIFLIVGLIDLPTRFGMVSWHAHEIIFGYFPAVMAGFLFTAVPNWTGRLPIVGWRLAGLAAVWLLGRVVVGFSAGLPPVIVAIADIAFLALFAAAIGREIISGRNWRNLPILGMICLLVLANTVFHWQEAQEGYAAGGSGFRLGLTTVVMLITLIGGRIVPSFTRNWLTRQGSDKRPAPIGRFDQIALMTSALTLALWAFLPDHPATAALCLFAGAINLWRLLRWAGFHTGAEPLVWILHVGYLFVPLGFLAIGADGLVPGLDAAIGAQHIWMAGAIGVMTLAVMTRASLGHAGLPLVATRPVTVVYFTLILAVAARAAAALAPDQSWLIHLSATGWILAFAGYAVIYWPILTRPRR